MDYKEKKIFELHYFMERIFENGLDVAEADKLQQLLLKDDDLLNYYFRLVELQAGLHQLKHLESIPSLSKGEFDDLFIGLAKCEEVAPTIKFSEDKPKRDLIPKVNRQKIYQFNKRSFISAVISVAALLLIILFARFAPVRSGHEVATLVDSIDAKWVCDDDLEMTIGSRLADTDPPLMLREGFVELLFDNETKAVIEGPSEFQILTSNQIKLNYGRIYTVVQEQGYGFTVCTPNSMIIDLGTEFGVQQIPHGNTELHVIKGKTNLITNTKSSKMNLVVAEGTAKKLAGTTEKVSDIALQENMFVRGIDSKANFVWKGQAFIDLADIVGGGNGFGTGRNNYGYQAGTGEFKQIKSMASITMADAEGLRKTENPYIDCVFYLADPENVVVDSAGHIFEACPETSRTAWTGIYNGAWYGSESPLIRVHPGSMGSFSAEKDPTIGIHSNQGITFDLMRIRQSIPGFKIKALHAYVGHSRTAWENSQKFPEYIKEGFGAPVASFYVLVDGVVRFEKIDMKAGDAPIEIDIKINSSEQYLSFVTTDGSDQTINYDWIMLAEPRLEIE